MSDFYTEFEDAPRGMFVNGNFVSAAELQRAASKRRFRYVITWAFGVACGMALMMVVVLYSLPADPTAVLR